jgi:hypothetical protein
MRFLEEMRLAADADQAAIFLHSKRGRVVTEANAAVDDEYGRLKAMVDAAARTFEHVNGLEPRLVRVAAGPSPP